MTFEIEEDDTNELVNVKSQQSAEEKWSAIFRRKRPSPSLNANAPQEKKVKKDQCDPHICLLCSQELARGSKSYKQRHWARKHSGEKGNYMSVIVTINHVKAQALLKQKKIQQREEQIANEETVNTVNTDLTSSCTSTITSIFSGYETGNTNVIFPNVLVTKDSNTAGKIQSTVADFFDEQGLQEIDDVSDNPIARIEDGINQILVRLQALNMDGDVRRRSSQNPITTEIEAVSDAGVKAASNLVELNGQNNSWGLGLIYDVARTEKYSQGSNQEWYSLKNRILEHVNCSSTRNAGQFHMKALQYHLSQKQRKERNIDTNVKLVSAGIEICKIKTAPLSYESLVAFLSFCGVDVGTIGHGRLPHFSVAIDKSTPHKDTYQAIMIFLPVNGKRTAMPIDAPLVYEYRDADSDDEDTIRGGYGEDLAVQVFMLMDSTKRVHFKRNYTSFWYKTYSKSQGLKGLETVTYATTGFSSSAFDQWKKIYNSYPALVTAYSANREDKKDDCEETKHQLRSQDFAIDLCGIIDVFQPVVSLMFKCQEFKRAPLENCCLVSYSH
ncbi:uncharacterized protein LOC124456224 [Xenia sp. Carnegie-2017]|uniref:uncharacterized protein LOC124456224 n=1 Tax=Xenia sp. Carnegie-2017 TaxID=2897299 RepID=UPI001F04BB03|nr:uncharacterized protein LOC124456224 [Xenia sp. Carnegie-2017]